MSDNKCELDYRVAVIKATQKRISLKTDAQMGRLGEKFAKVSAGKIRIPSLTKTAKYRVPDVLSDSHLVEVKNVRYQAVTKQLLDFLAFCDKTDRRLVLCLRDDARLSSKVQGLVQSGKIEIGPLGYIFTRAGQAKFLKAIEPILSRVLADGKLYVNSLRQHLCFEGRE